jgi:hypothetical protein
MASRAGNGAVNHARGRQAGPETEAKTSGKVSRRQDAALSQNPPAARPDPFGEYAPCTLSVVQEPFLQVLPLGPR